VTTYTYDYRNRMVGAIEENSSHTVLMQATYVYDALDRRIETNETISGTNTTTWTVYDGQNAYADFNGSGVLQERYLYGPAVDQILARVSSSGTTNWYLEDILGSVTDIVDKTGTVLDHITYDSFGNVTSQSNASDGDRFKFDAMSLDSAIGEYYDNARYYESIPGRFASEDPEGLIAGDSNLFRFVDNGPTDGIDPSGLQQPGRRGRRLIPWDPKSPLIYPAGTYTYGGPILAPVGTVYTPGPVHYPAGLIYSPPGTSPLFPEGVVIAIPQPGQPTHVFPTGPPALTNPAQWYNPSLPYDPTQWLNPSPPNIWNLPIFPTYPIGKHGGSIRFFPGGTLKRPTLRIDMRL
jgi:RHS repeat-associated protein